MDRQMAILNLIHEGKNFRTTITGGNYALNACKALGLTDSETVAIMYALEYCDKDGVPHAGRPLKIPQIPTHTTQGE